MICDLSPCLSLSLLSRPSGCLSISWPEAGRKAESPPKPAASASASLRPNARSPSPHSTGLWSLSPSIVLQRCVLGGRCDAEMRLAGEDMRQRPDLSSVSLSISPLLYFSSDCRTNSPTPPSHPSVRPSLSHSLHLTLFSLLSLPQPPRLLFLSLFLLSFPFPPSALLPFSGRHPASVPLCMPFSFMNVRWRESNTLTTPRPSFLPTSQFGSFSSSPPLSLHLNSHFPFPR